MGNSHDQFNDIKNGTSGIFGADQAGLMPTLARHDSVYTHPTKDGLVMEFHCDGCGAATQVTLEWPEVVALKYGLNPADAFRHNKGYLQGSAMAWEFVREENNWKPHQKCRSGCSFTFAIRLDPTEPERHLKVARRSGWINPEGEKRVNMLCAQMVQSAQQRRR